MLVISFVLSLFTLQAQASVPVTFLLTQEGANEWVKVMYGAPATTVDAKCEVHVIRPIDLEPAIETHEQRVTCAWNGGLDSKTTEWSRSMVDSWGDRHQQKSFALTGEAAEMLLTKFQQKTKGMPDPEPKGTMWSRLFLCDAFGAICLQTVFLLEKPTADSAGLVACSRNTSLKKQSTIKFEMDPAQSYPDYLNAMVDAQIAAGERTLDKVMCVFMAP